VRGETVLLAAVACAFTLVGGGCGSDDATRSTAQRDDPAANIVQPPLEEASESEPSESATETQSLDSKRLPAEVRADNAVARVGSIRPSCSEWYVTNHNTYEYWCLWQFDAGYNFQVYYYWGLDERWHPYWKCWWPRGSSELTCDAY
jgi:hypothetical protein